MTAYSPKRLLTTAILISGMALSLNAIANTSGQTLLETTIPPAARTAVVALNTRQNGRTVSISTFESTQPAEEILTFYRNHWPAGSDVPGSLEAVVDQWQIISHIENGYLVALQLQNSDSGASSGYLSVMQLESPGNSEAPPIPLPPGGEVLSTTSHVDTSPQAVTWVVRSSAGVGLVSAFYRDALERDGWKAVSVSISKYPHVLMMNGPRGSLEVIVSEAQDGSSVAVVNRVNNHE